MHFRESTSSRKLDTLVGEQLDIRSDSSEETQKVVKAIDDIAFQTNLLALNANVEAARAGMYGKGFAVFAEEVRNLANRSAEAVEETSRIVEKSKSKISAGASATEQTVQQFRLIAEQTDKIAELLAQVSESSTNQSGAIQEINAGLAQIDDVTQSNSATAEESSSAADELEQMTVRLSKLMSGFTVRDTYESKHSTSALQDQADTSIERMAGQGDQAPVAGLT